MKNLICLSLLLFATPSAYANVTHYRQWSQDKHTQFINTLSCKTADKSKCSLQTLVVSDDKAKNSCYVVYKTLFKDQRLIKAGPESFRVQMARAQCGDNVTFTFGQKTMLSQYSAVKNAPVTQNEDCDLFKSIAQEAGSYLSEAPLIPQVGFGECKTLTFKMED